MYYDLGIDVAAKRRQREVIGIAREPERPLVELRRERYVKLPIHQILKHGRRWSALRQTAAPNGKVSENLRRPRIAGEFLIDAKDPIGGNRWVGLLQVHGENRARNPHVAPRARTRRQMREGVSENRAPRLPALLCRSGTIVQFPDERVANGARHVAPHQNAGVDPPLYLHQVMIGNVERAVSPQALWNLNRPVGVGV